MVVIIIGQTAHNVNGLLFFLLKRRIGEGIVRGAMRESSVDQQNLADRLILTFDFDGDISKTLRIGQDYGDQIHAIKVGMGFAQHPHAHVMRAMLDTRGIDMYLDARYMEDPDQMHYNVGKNAQAGYRYVSVAAYAGVASLRSAAEAVADARRNLNLVAMIKNRRPKDLGRDQEIDTIVAVNDELPHKNRISAVMCNVGQLDRVKGLDVLKIVTGIRIAPDDVDHHEEVTTPSEALEQGADKLAVGRPIVESADPLGAFAKYVADMRTAVEVEK